jgi:regulator of protease activity HflC (stomatin/prohibitin superfamily)
MSALLNVVAFVVGLIVVSMYAGMHRVEEGHIGVYYFGGALLDRVTDPGFHFQIPFVTTFDNVQVTLQTDVVKDIPCGTSGGSVIYFDKVEVVNLLDKTVAHTTIKKYGVNYDKTWIFDRIHHEINQFCSSHTLQEVYIDKFDILDEALANALQKSCDDWQTGIKIVSIRVTKPRIPEAVRRNYEQIETQKTQFLIQMEQEKVAKKEEDIQRMRETVQAQKEAEVAKINAEKLATISLINSEKEIHEKEAERTKRTIDDEIFLSHKKAMTDAEHYELTQRAIANKQLYSDEYLRFVLYTSLANNTKIYFGEKIPNIFVDLIPRGEGDKKLPFP